MFSIIRQKNGYTKNPSARMFRSCFVSICSFSLMKASDECNCELDEDEFLSLDVLSDINISKNENLLDNEKFDPINYDKILNNSISSISSESEEEIMIVNNKMTLEECSIVYFSGYLVKCCIDNFKCAICKSSMLTKEIINYPNQTLIIQKTFEHIDFFGCEGMKKPSNFIINICKISLKVFECNFETIKSEIGITKKLIEIIVKKINKKNIILEKLECKEHILYIIKLLLTTRIYKECKWLKEQISTKSTKQQPKLRIFQHK